MLIYTQFEFFNSSTYHYCNCHHFFTVDSKVVGYGLQCKWHISVVCGVWTWFGLHGNMKRKAA